MNVFTCNMLLSVWELKGDWSTRKVSGRKAGTLRWKKSLSAAGQCGQFIRHSESYFLQPFVLLLGKRLLLPADMKASRKRLPGVMTKFEANWCRSSNAPLECKPIELLVAKVQDAEHCSVNSLNLGDLDMARRSLGRLRWRQTPVSFRVRPEMLSPLPV